MSVINRRFLHERLGYRFMALQDSAIHFNVFFASEMFSDNSTHRSLRNLCSATLRHTSESLFVIHEFCFWRFFAMDCSWCFYFASNLACVSSTSTNSSTFLFENFLMADLVGSSDRYRFWCQRACRQCSQRYISPIFASLLTDSVGVNWRKKNRTKAFASD